MRIETKHKRTCIRCIRHSHLHHYHILLLPLSVAVWSVGFHKQNKYCILCKYYAFTHSYVIHVIIIYNKTTRARSKRQGGKSQSNNALPRWYSDECIGRIRIYIYYNNFKRYPILTQIKYIPKYTKIGSPRLNNINISSLYYKGTFIFNVLLTRHLVQYIILPFLNL